MQQDEGTGAQTRRSHYDETCDTDNTGVCAAAGGSVIGHRARDVAGAFRDPAAIDAVWQLMG